MAKTYRDRHVTRINMISKNKVYLKESFDKGKKLITIKYLSINLIHTLSIPVFIIEYITVCPNRLYI